MKCFLSVIALALLLAVAEPSADKVYTWSDRDGNLHITNRPPPDDAQVRDVISYTPEPREKILERRRRREADAESSKRAEASQIAGELAAEAEAARRAADHAKTEAEEAVLKSRAYIDKHSSSKRGRKIYKYRMERSDQDASAAVERARAAEERALRAEQEAQSALDAASEPEK